MARIAIVGAKRLDRLDDGAPERCRRLWVDRRRQRRQQFARVAGERRADDDLLAEGPDPSPIVEPKVFDELRGAVAKQRQVSRHAAGHVEHHDETDRGRRVVEERDRLRLPFVANLEIVLRQRGDETAVLVRHRHEGANEIAAAAKGRRLGCCPCGGSCAPRTATTLAATRTLTRIRTMSRSQQVRLKADTTQCQAGATQDPA